MRSRWPFILALLLLLVIAPARSQQAQGGVPPRLPFLTGADLSELPIHESRGVKYRDGGKAQDLLTIAKHNGWTVIRVRLWVNPDNKPNAEVSSLPNVTALGKRIKAAGLQFLLDIHYSDTWADPGHQTKPKAWADLPFPQLVQKTHDYSRDVIAHLRQNDAMPDLVQIGNETKNGLLYGTDTQPGGGFWDHAPGGWDRAAQLFAAGLSGVRAGAKPLTPPRTILHIPDGQDTEFVKNYLTTLQLHAHDAKPPLTLDFDIISLSYYPSDPWDKKAGFDAWHLSHLTNTMNYIATTLHKPVMIVETNWPQAGKPNDMPGTPEFPFTPDGQAQFYRALIRDVRAVPNGLGVGVVTWNTDTLNWDSVFDAQGNDLPAVRVLGQKQQP